MDERGGEKSEREIILMRNQRCDLQAVVDEEVVVGEASSLTLSHVPEERNARDRRPGSPGSWSGKPLVPKSRRMVGFLSI